jgi:preprotein translocase subunit SecE
MKKVTSPSRKEVQATTTVVIITVFLFAFFFWVVDLAISNSLERMLHYLSRR